MQVIRVRSRFKQRPEFIFTPPYGIFGPFSFSDVMNGRYSNRATVKFRMPPLNFNKKYRTVFVERLVSIGFFET